MRALADTSVIIDLPRLDPAQLPDDLGISVLTLAELAAGPHTAGDHDERATRQERLQWAEASLEALPVDATVARAYGRVYAAVIDAGRSPRARVVDMLIAAVALANDLPLVTRNAADFAGIDGLIEILAV